MQYFKSITILVSNGIRTHKYTTPFAFLLVPILLKVRQHTTFVVFCLQIKYKTQPIEEVY